ncbi:Crp/Fnr family transcriptional regulator [Cyclobacterium salsum]|uniref:Crp/Fnr family transcriptional regulator n=1 Tax=Cyclobacterium salsum TaxID=2666329 RepID=UPI001390D75C|nr:Crp/Fnr family transcriptional regulator [Cyclobacterium salsum]
MGTSAQLHSEKAGTYHSDVQSPVCSVQDFYHHPELGPGDLEQIARAHEYQQLSRGTMLLQEGQHANAYYCIGSGIVRSFATNPSGKDITTGFTCRGQIAIEVASLFLGVPTKENFQTLSDCQVWKIPLISFHKLFNQIPAFASWGREWMSQALLMYKLRALRMITETAKDRYLRLQREQPELLQQVPLKYIASFLGVTDTSLSRIRKEIARGN